MDAIEKRKFIRELVANVQKDILAKVDAMPPDWDGHELRRYIADKFEDSAALKQSRAMRRRYNAYKNAVIVNNL